MCQSIWGSVQGFLQEQVSVLFNKREALCILMQNEIELMNTLGTIAFEIICILFSSTKWLWCGNLVLVDISL